MHPTNLNILNDNIAPSLVAAAAFLRAHPHTLCITARNGDSAVLQKLLAADGGGLSPSVISTDNLQTAAACVRAPHLVVAARLAAVSAAAVRRERILAVYQLLNDSSPSENAAILFSRAAALADFFDEFVESRPSLTIAADEIPRLCEEMLRETGAGFSKPETEVVSLLWELLHSRLHIARDTLAEFARIAPPIVFAGSESPRPWIADFLRQCANGADIFAPPENAPDGDIAEWRPPAAHIVRCFEGAAPSLNRAAGLALTMVRQFAAADKSVGIVVYDRLLARRLRALAETRGIRIQDDGGWRMETLSFGGALRQWCDAVFAFTPANFGAILSPPFWRYDSHRADAAEEWRQLVAGDKSLPNSLRDFEQARFANAAFAPIAEKLAAARDKCPSAATPREWTRWLLAHSAAAAAAWRDDPVAARLRAKLAAADGESRLTASAFRAWLQMFMRTETGGGGDVSGRACFVLPTTLRRFDSLILLGAHGGNLPVAPDLFWGENGRRAMQLPSRETEIARQLAQFARLIKSHSHIAAVRYETGHGRDCAPSPFWTLLTDEIKNNGGVVEIIAPPPAQSSRLSVCPPPPAAGRLRAPPDSVRITAAADLMRCPYRFFAHHLLRLDESEEDDILLPARRGALLHRGLKNFIENAGDETDADKLLALWKTTLAALPATRAGAKLAVQHWILRGALFVRNEAARRAEGWAPDALECAAETILPPRYGGFALRGRIDRIDRNSRTGEWTITDYKSGGAPNKKAMQTGEEPQLPLYEIVAGKPQARWRICRPADDAKTIETGGDALRIAARLRIAAAQIVGGAPLCARKSDECVGCAARRLCRRDHWRTEAIDENAAH